MKLIGILAAAAGMMLLALSGHGAVSQMARTIRIVVPFPAGGSADELARLLADQIGRTRGVNFVIENRPGAGTVVATEAVSRAAPDGNTLLIVANSFVINPSLKKLSYDPFASFAPVCHLVSSPLIIAVNSDSPYRNLADLINAAHQRIQSAPDLPTVAESGYQNYETEVWFGLVAPAKTPADTISQLSSWFGSALQTDAVKQKLQPQEMYPVGTCGADFAAYLRKQFDEYARVIREADIKAE
jgi:tripartite-type tricarboxylate transporter receptor subunit TctC